MTDGIDLLALRDRAAECRIVVIGGGIGGLVSALEFAKLGIRVTVLEAAEHCGGALRSGEVAGLTLDLGAESFATRGGHVAALIEELGLSDDVVSPEHGVGGAWVAGIPGVGAAPLPRGGVLGIPGNPFADDVRRVIGWGGAWRAYLDRLRPVLTIGHASSLGKLVRSRLGTRVLDRLVAPVTSGVYSASPDDIDPDVAAPGLNTAITRAGSLTGAVLDLSSQRASAPGGAVQGLSGGMYRLVAALVERIEHLGGEVRTSVPVAELMRDGEGWIVRCEAIEGHDEESETIAADAVVVATDEKTARELIAPHTDGALSALPPVAGPVVDIVTLVVRSPALVDAPRGTGVLTVPGSHRAKALTHASAKWAWVREQAGAGVHVIRVSFGTASEQPATDGLTPDNAALLALEEASSLLGVALTRQQLLGHRTERYAQSQPAAMIGLREQTDAARAAIRSARHVGSVGAWLSGTGLAQVVPDAIEEADRVRRALLFAP
ncbi:protoporphyrinogen/coproporphyrinogen oxidase [Microbacterium amylolyticum]|uniref:Oxygen-dependent protoporphyrinogen oxidase n=1 Tax=Microbacterium amylolyticum TaxID=936337 RepID=A0ABS4ZHE2_9MICO|nr:FAD-dependent oxidoreductase [Microbacterium amylolyticum]MBP2436693.1 oxygen-dependent protoporphyrinogen oxidase [Microbacterium amylolyticum]